MVAEEQEKGSGQAQKQLTNQIARFIRHKTNCDHLGYDLTQSGGMTGYMKQRLIVVDERQLEP